MPVGLRNLLITTMACLLLPVAAQAAVRVLIRYASQLENDKAVRSFVQPYTLLSSANIVYAQCGTELGITSEQQTWLKAQFEQVSRDYLKAYDDAFIAQTGVASGKDMTDQYVKALTDQQQVAVNRTALAIQQKKCRDSQITRIADYIETLRQQDLAEKAQPVPASAPATPIKN